MHVDRPEVRRRTESPASCWDEVDIFMIPFAAQTRVSSLVSLVRSQGCPSRTGSV